VLYYNNQMIGLQNSDPAAYRNFYRNVQAADSKGAKELELRLKFLRKRLQQRHFEQLASLMAIHSAELASFREKQFFVSQKAYKEHDQMMRELYKAVCREASNMSGELFGCRKPGKRKKSRRKRTSSKLMQYNSNKTEELKTRIDSKFRVLDDALTEAVRDYVESENLRAALYQRDLDRLRWIHTLREQLLYCSRKQELIDTGLELCALCFRHCNCHVQEEEGRKTRMEAAIPVLLYNECKQCARILCVDTCIMECKFCGYISCASCFDPQKAKGCCWIMLEAQDSHIK
jgi:hypothetical protein